MTLTLELTADEADRVRAAPQSGTDVTALMRDLVSGLPQNATHQLARPNEVKNGKTEPVKTIENDPTFALLARWQEEDAAATPEEIEESERQWEALKQGINANRAEVGARRIF